MSHFTTEVLVPNQQPKVSAFFRVLAPAFLLTMGVAFFRTYYVMNGYPAPMLLNILLVLAFCVLPIVWWHTWYHNTVEKKGELHLDSNSIDVHWDNPSVAMRYPLSEVSNLQVIFDGYDSGLLSPKDGTQNSLKFTHNSTAYHFNFRLASEEAAGEMAKVLKSWYERGIPFAELDTKGRERYLMVYEGQYKQALA